ncbi:MAG TPA: response regulator, partial [Gemmataceae bacterium]|nr:response regulator [Gemmataceae bacterium]
PPSVFHLVETMMTLVPHQRFQTPSQLLDAIRAARRDLEGKAADGRAGPAARAVFVVERNEHLQDVIRDKLKESGYRVFLAADPLRAVDRFRQQPYDALVVDAGTVGEDGLLVLERVQRDAEARGVTCAGIVMLNKDQADWAGRVQPRQQVAVMVQPVTIKQLHRKLQELAPTGS